ncbi:hypothetical protein BARVI_08515 [Barnesiella viscericola DSM 18177]|uniref:Uncharacterized protein n=1 Tax=Barnesiella viscericola DSM 18177 TaxID=880074 RepID=W0EXD1_9BACT|nr:hypothetical protein BARVI_08515 [Barnesiella viscericola DSM 18177]
MIMRINIIGLRQISTIQIYLFWRRGACGLYSYILGFAAMGFDGVAFDCSLVACLNGVGVNGVLIPRFGGIAIGRFWRNWIDAGLR